MKQIASKASMKSAGGPEASMKPNGGQEASMKSTGGPEPAPPADTEARLAAETATETVVVLRGLSLQLRRGRLVGVAGAVGAGKSSLLAAIMGRVSHPRHVARTSSRRGQPVMGPSQGKPIKNKS